MSFSSGCPISPSSTLRYLYIFSTEQHMGITLIHTFTTCSSYLFRAVILSIFAFSTQQIYSQLKVCLFDSKHSFGAYDQFDWVYLLTITATKCHVSIMYNSIIERQELIQDLHENGFEIIECYSLMLIFLS